jgi:flagellar hook-associated protein 2
VDGTDVAGTINGEACTGKGQILTGNSGNLKTDGLVIKATATTTGSFGTICVTKGVASTLADYLNFITEPLNGLIDTTESSLQSKMTDIDKDIAKYEERIALKQDQLLAKFAAMESAMGRLQSEGNYIASQAAQLSSNWGSNK